MAARRRRVKGEEATALPKKDAGTIKVFRSYTVSGAKVDESEGLEELEVKTFLADPAYISVNHGRTVNTGEYESARLDVRVSIPCYAEEINEALLYADDVAHAFLEDSIKAYIEEIK